MRLDLTNLQVESFDATSTDASETTTIYDTGKGGPESYCYICYPTGNTDPACQPQPVPETKFFPCTRYEQTCVGCA